MNLANVMLSDRSQTHKTAYCIIPFIGNVRKRQTHRDRKACSGWGWEGGERGTKGCQLKGMGGVFEVLKIF